MKKLFMILSLVFLLCFTFGCQKAEEVVEEGLTEEEVNVMMVEAEKVWNNADMEACDRVFSADYVEHDPLSGDTIGLDAFKERVRAGHEMYSSINLSIHETFIKGNKVAVLATWKVTHISGADIELSVVNIMRIEDGKFVESTYYYDTKKELEQWGYKIIPPEEQEKKEEPEKK
jgi:ketosteroid isomerase-like protein